MAAPPTVSARVLRTLRAAGLAAQVDVDGIFGELGLSAEALAGTDARVPLAAEEAAWKRVAEAAGDPLFGLTAVASIEADEYDVFGYALRNSATFGDALKAVSRFNRLLHDIAEIRIEREGELVRVVHRFRGTLRPPTFHASLFTVAAWVGFGRALTGRPWVPAAAWFPHPSPDDPRPLARFLGVDPEFERPDGGLALEARLLDLPVLGADPGLHRVLERHAELLLGSLPDASTTLSDRVRESLATGLPRGEADIAAASARLGMSPRTLQRRLATEGTTFQELLDAIRKELATTLLADADRSVAEVAFLLGYSEPSPFQRAFKRWTGLTAGAFRSR